MLSSISWQHYFAAVIILTISYYGYVVLRYYQVEIAKLFNHKQVSSKNLAGFVSSSVSVMGPAKPDHDITIFDNQELQFTDSSPDEPEIISPLSTNDSKEQLAGDVSQELIHEADNLIEAFREMNDKQEFLMLLAILIDSYKRFKDDIDLPATLQRIIELSKERLQFPIALSDLQNTWS